jgi:hypothetical protein
MAVELIAPLERAWTRMLRILFRPFALKTWLAIGFGAWLGGAGNCRGSLSFQDWSPPSPGAGAELESVGRWFASHLWVVLAVAVPLIVTVLIVSLAWLWLRAHGWFVFLDNVVRERADTAAAWNENRSLAHSAFLWYLGFGVIVLVAVGLLIVPIALATSYSAGGTPPLGLLLSAVPIGVLIALTAACTRLFFISFVIPIMYHHRVGAVPAWGRVIRLMRIHIGGFALFVVVAVIAGIGFAMVVLVVGLMTCCIAFIPLLIPYVSTVVLLPAWVIWRAFSVEFLRQFGPDFDLFAPENERIQPI